jgi:hypothetical protein
MEVSKVVLLIRVCEWITEVFDPLQAKKPIKAVRRKNVLNMLPN